VAGIVIRIDAGDTEGVVRILGALKDKQGLLEQVGNVIVEDAHHAFYAQRHGKELWPHRYPNQQPPYLNIAGTIEDFSRGKDAPKDRRFTPSPALRDTNQLINSIAFQVTGEDSVEVGTTVPYASVHNFGGVSSQRVTGETKNRIAKWLLTPKGRAYRDKLLPVLKKNLTTWDTQVVRRQFIGLTSDLANDLHTVTVDHLKEVTGGGDS